MSRGPKFVLAERLGVTKRTVDNWIARGMPQAPEAAEAWKAMNVIEEPALKGRRAGAGRKLGQKDSYPRASGRRGTETEAPKGSDRAQRLEKLAAGDLSRADLERTLQETKIINAVREADIEAGKLMVAAEAEQAWGELLQAHRTELDGLAGRVESRAGSELRLTNEQGRVLRGIIESEVAALFKRLLEAEWGK